MYNTNQSWSHPQPSFDRAHLQLEHEFDFSSIIDDRQSSQDSQSALQDSYQYQQSGGAISPQSTLHNSYTPQSQSRTSSFGTNGPSPSNSMDNTFQQGLYGSTNMAQGPSMLNSSTFLGQPIADQPQNSYQQQHYYQGATLDAVDNGQRAMPPFLSQSPGPMHDTFPHLTAQQNALYQSTLASGSGPSNAKRQRNNGHYGDDEKDEPEMANDAKDEVKIKPLVIYPSSPRLSSSCLLSR